MSNHVFSKYFQSKENPIINEATTCNCSDNEEAKFVKIWEGEEEKEDSKRRKLAADDQAGIWRRRRPCPEDQLSTLSRPSFSTDALELAMTTDEVDIDRPATSGSSSISNRCTPLEQLYLDMKCKHPGVVLLIETGYLFRFFLEDAEIASKVLHMNVFAGHNMRTNSIPMQTLRTTVRRLVAEGHKVGVVRKVETALMKMAATVCDSPNDTDDSSWNSNGLYRRELTDVYTKATFIDEDLNPDVSSGDTSEKNGNCNYLMCIYDIQVEPAVVRVGIVAVCPSSGDMIQDHFLDGERRHELECRFVQIRPVEIIVSDVGITEGTLQFINAVIHSSLYVHEVVRVERLSNEHFKLERALESLREFYAHESELDSSLNLMSVAMELEPPVLCCLSAVLRYLRDFNLEYILKLINFMRQFTSRSANVYLDSMTVRSLELFWTGSANVNSKEGNLHCAMDRTMTAFGSRLIKNWIGQPLRSKKDIDRRLSAVAEILSNSTLKSLLTSIMKNQWDLESGITSIFHKKCSCRKYWRVVSTFVALKNLLNDHKDWIQAAIESSYLKSLLTSTTNLLTGIEALRKNLNFDAVWKGDEHRVFVDWGEFPDVVKVQQEIGRVVSKLLDLVPLVNEALGIDDFKYSTYNGTEYVVLLNASAECKIPSNWITIARSKAKICCRTPQMQYLATQLAMLQQHLHYEGHLAWHQYLDKFRSFYQRLRQAVANLAILDCLCSFATVAEHENLVRPVIVDFDRPVITITGGYHMVASKFQLLGKSYIKNNTDLGWEMGPSCLILSGSNMGGKSCYARQVALIALMAQMGSFVPAESATLTPLDAVYIRSGVRDCIMAGKSSFFVEASDMAYTLTQATSKSLVVVDGFGQSTSDSDGAVLAFGVLRFCLEEINCLVIAVTHFSEVTTLEQVHPKHVKNYHMSTIVSEIGAQETIVTYLYQLEEGTSEAGYASNVAKLAGIDDRILHVAAVKSRQIELKLKNRSRLSGMSVAMFRYLHHMTSSGGLTRLLSEHVLDQN